MEFKKEDGLVEAAGAEKVDVMAEVGGRRGSGGEERGGGGA